MSLYVFHLVHLKKLYELECRKFFHKKMQKIPKYKNVILKKTVDVVQQNRLQIRNQRHHITVK